MYTSQHLDSKTYRAHFLDSIIGDHKHLDHALYAFRHVDATNYGAHHLDPIIGDLEHLYYALDTFRHVDASYIHPLFSTVSEVNSTCPLPCIYLFLLPSKNGFGRLAEIDLRRLLALAKRKSHGSQSEISFFSAYR